MKTKLFKSFTVKTTKKAVRRLCEDAESLGMPVEHKIKGDVDNIYINGQLVAETMPGYAGVVIKTTYRLSDLALFKVRTAWRDL